jgi:predicted CXXCH cytochrome family protein
MPRSHLLVPVLAVIFLATSLAAAADNCLTGTCHSATVSVKRPHAPAKDGDCLSCHKQDTPQHPTPGKKGFSLVAKGEKLCAPCHELPGKGSVVHPPVKDGDCLACHKPHGADGRFLLKNSEDLSGLCFECHDKTPFTNKRIHGPVAAGACSTCHTPHRSVEKALLKEPVNTVCLNCHADIKSLVSSSRVIHPPIQVAGCISCHDPHSSANLNLGIKKMPELCFDCHKTIESKLSKVKYLHKPLTQERGCGACHSPHASQIKKLLPVDEKTLCLDCHGNNKLAPLKNIAEELKGKKSVHGPIAVGRCSGCHDPHGSNNFRLLTGPYPETLYAPYKEGIYDLCLKCHNKNLLKFPDTTVYTGFRNGKRNLHYVHVVNSRKGRTCRICHEPHAANGPKLTNIEGARFGTWKIPFRLELTETGGRCSSGCHQSLAYDRITPVAYSSPVPKKFGAASSARQGARK